MNIFSVTVTYNPDLAVFIEQLQSIGNQIDTMVIVDNGSENIDEIKSALANYKFHLIELDINKGLSFAQNLGIKQVKYLQGDHVLLLDQDSILNVNFVKSMKSIYKKSNVELLGPVFYNPDTGKPYKGTNYLGPFLKNEAIQELTNVSFIIASGSFFSLDVYEKIGPMNEDLFVDYIDVDWCFRAKNIGFKVAMTSKASMSHTIGNYRISFLGRKISVHSPIRRYYLVRNSFFMLRQKYIPLGYKLREIVFNVIRSVISIAISKNKSQVIYYIRKAIRDGVIGKYGPLK